MPKRILKFQERGHYHINNRGLQKKKIFFDREDYKYFLKKMFEYKDKFSIEVIFYCLMPNHFHLVIRQNTGVGTIQFISMVQLLYAKYFNKKYGRKGQLFEGRYRPKVIKDQKYMMQLIRYLMENPVRAGLVKKPEDWEFLSFNAKLID
jgi:REP element-mobilizing transposase RayT